ncbi:hypothetical protein GEMRC1_004847 [Eukaryota sp. GEM-RC1]
MPLDEQYQTIRNQLLGSRSSPLPFYESVRTQIIRQKLWGRPSVSRPPTSPQQSSQSTLPLSLPVESSITFFSFLPDSSADFLAGTSSGQIHLCSPHSTTSPFQSPHRGPISSILFLPLGSFFLSSGLDKVVVMWNLQDCTPIKVFYFSEPVVSLVLSNDNPNFCIIGTPKTVSCLNLSNFSLISKTLPFLITSNLSLIETCFYGVVFGNEFGALCLLPVVFGKRFHKIQMVSKIFNNSVVEHLNFLPVTCQLLCLLSDKSIACFSCNKIAPVKYFFKYLELSQQIDIFNLRNLKFCFFKEKFIVASDDPDVEVREMNIDNTPVILKFCDTTGDIEFPSNDAPLYRGVDACLLVYDVNNPDSFDELDSLRENFLTQADLDPSDVDDFPFVVLGNKSDLLEDPSSLKDQASSWRQSHGNIPLFETSANDYSTIHTAILELVRSVLKRMAPLLPPHLTLIK